MKPYREWSQEELKSEQSVLQAKYEEYKAKGYEYDMSRGRPCTEQLDLCMELLDVVNSNSDLNNRDGFDCRNYGVVDGLPEAKEMMASMMGTRPENVIVFGNASLNIMYDTVAKSIITGVNGSTPWRNLKEIKFLCPVPGYDRHFAITEYFGIDMINIPMTESGPDMDLVEQYVNHDPAVKGIWCVPKYSNPQGLTYSDETVRRFANLKPAAEDFRIYWDNAYCIHDIFEDKHDELLDLLSECEKAGNPDMVYEFASTSKVSFPGAGISALAASPANIKDILNSVKFQTIGYDKINQLRHTRFFKDFDHLKSHMRNHAEIIRPKFELFLDRFEEDLEGMGVGSWIRPNGGYFIAFEANEGCAKEIVGLAKEAGVIMTGAGAPYPYGEDPKDSVIRIAPTLPPMEELKICCDIFILCVKLVAIKRILEN